MVATPPDNAAPPGELPKHAGVRRVIGNLLHLLGGKAVAGLLSLVYLVIVTHSLGARDYGVLILVNGYAVLIGSIVAFSGFHGVVRYGSQALEARDLEGLARIVRFMTVIELGFGLFAMAVAAILVPFVGPRLGWSDETIMIALPYSLAVLATVRATPQGILQVAQRFDLIGIHQVVSPLIRLIGAALLWMAGAGLTGFIAVWLIASIFECIAMWAFGLHAWRKLATGHRLIGPWRGVMQERGGFGRFIVITNFDITLRELAPNLAPLTVGWLLGPAAAGLLALAQRASALLQQPAVLLSQASYAVLADLSAKRQFATLRHTVWQSAMLAGLVAVPIVGVLAILGGHVLVLLGGKTFTGGTMLLVLIALGRLVGLMAAPIAAGLTAMGLPQRSMGVALFTNLALFPFLPLMLWWIGIDGAGWHSMVQSALALAILGLFFVRDLRRAT